ncbi:hypothetical protein D3C72_1806540 [compost metagenome]
MQARVASVARLVGGGLLDGLGQGRPTEILVFDIDRLGRIVDGLQVQFFDVAFAFLWLGTQQLGQQRGAATEGELLRHLHGLARSEKTLTGFLAPGSGEIVVQVFQDRPPTWLEISWRGSVPRGPALGAGLLRSERFSAECWSVSQYSSSMLWPMTKPMAQSGSS